MRWFPGEQTLQQAQGRCRASLEVQGEELGSREGEQS